jgi:3-dehydrotetronate 4-kinase
MRSNNASQRLSNRVWVAIVDAISNADLHRLAPALADMPLVTAGSGVAIGLPANFGIVPNERAAALPPAQGLQAVIAGSCSRATNAQVAAFVASGRSSYVVDPHADGLKDRMRVRYSCVKSLAWATPQLVDGPVLIYSTAQPDALKAIQTKLGIAEVGEWVEQTLALIARGLVQAGVAQLVVAGGETSGAVVQALGMQQLQIGAQIDPGVPWCAGNTNVNDQILHITLKSGNFGTEDFLLKAFGKLSS